ncbi:hypothetical protein BGZ93_004087, partial [Podila epicladia]
MSPFDVNVTRTWEIVQRLRKTLAKFTGTSSTTATSGSITSTLSSASTDISQRTSMNPNLNNKNHSALAQLGHKIIPVFAGTEKIDFDRVHFKEATGISGPPTLNLEERFRRTTRADFDHQLVEEVMKFLRKYKDHYKGYLTDNFDEASWRFMHRALAPSHMDEVFTAQLKHVPEENRTFTKVESIVWDIFRLSDLTGAVLQKLFTFKSDVNEGPGTFVFRVEALIQGAKAEEVPSRFINDAIYRALPAQGRLALKTKFPDFNVVKYSEVLAFISQAPNILSGEREQKDEWAMQKWAKHLLVQKAVTSLGTASQESTHQRPFKRAYTESETQ